MQRIVDEARERWPVGGVYLHHRLGRLEIGEVSVVAVAASPHRAEAYAASRHLIERLKADVPIWKKEVFVDGSEWVGAPGEC
jgi:molybdopterin synthase catalytic subunit